MALRRHKYTIGDVVKVAIKDKEELEQCTIAQYLYDEINDCFTYRMNELCGWHQERDITLVATYISIKLGEVVLPSETQ